MSGPAPLAASGRTALSLWAGLAGLALWAPAVTLPGLALPLQPMDGLVLAGGPLLLLSLGRLPPGLLPVLGPGLLSIALSWAMNGGSALVLGWSLAFALPFVALVALAAADARARGVLLGGFMLGAGLSVALFLAQILRGAEALDFRNNPAFRLPAQYGRGFALMPEVSTFAVHALIALGMVLAWLRAGRQAGDRWVGRRGAIGQSSAPSSAPLSTLFPALLLAISLVVALALTRSTSVLVLLPVLVALALGGTSGGSVGRVTAPLRHPVSAFRTPQRRGLGWLGLLVITGVLVLILAGFVQLFYAERLASASAERSASMRLASVLGGLTPLHRGELFGVGIGENAAVRLRAHEVARALGLRFGTLPEGVNSQIVGRLFEEGWPALLHLSVAAALLWRGWRRHRRGPAPDRAPDRIADRVVTTLWMLAWGGFLAALLVVGYRGIYTTWLWLGLVAGLGSAQAVGAGRNTGPAPRAPPSRFLWPAT